MLIKNQTLIGVLVLLIVLACSVSAITDENSDVVTLFDRGQIYLKEGSYQKAADIFSELETRFSDSKNLGLFIFNRSKAKLYLNSYNEAAAGFKQFISQFPSSPLKAHADYFLGNALYNNGDVNKAVKAYFDGYRISSDSKLDDLLFESINGSFSNSQSISLGVSDFQTMPQNKKCLLIESLADIYINRGKQTQANALLEECGREVDNSTAVSNSSDLEIAMVVPMSGEMKDFGQDIYNGAVIAAELYRKDNNRSIKIKPYDTKGDPIEAARLVNEIASNNNIDVVVGPLTSEEAGVCSAALSCLTLPMIVPAATQAGLTRLSETSYQLSPNIELEGITLADYAINVLKADTVVILSSTATDQLRMSRAFAKHYQRLGGTVAAVEYFRNRDKDFGNYLLDVKKSLLGVPEDSTELINYDGDTLDYEDVPIYIDCFFIAGNGRQLKQLLPQINYHNMHGYYLGSDGWGEETVYKLGDDITKKAVFASPFLEGKSSEQYLKLAAEYDRRYGSQPQRLTALGYDAVNIILNSLGSQQIDRAAITESLKHIKDYIGASGKISFGEYRENIEMPMYRIISEQAELLNLNNSEQPE